MSKHINSPGTVATSACMAAMCFLILATRADAQCQYEVTAVLQHPGCPPPFTSGSLTATAMNNLGHVTGYYVNCVTLRDEGFIWTPEGGLVTMTRPSGVVEVNPEDINDAGVVCGTWENINVPGSRRGFVRWTDGTYTELDTFSGSGSSKAHAINENNIVVGERATTNKPVPTVAFKWTREAGFIDITPPEDSGVAFAVSNNGVIAGAVYETPSTFIWINGILQTQGIPPGATRTEFRALGTAAGMHAAGINYFTQPGSMAARPAPISWDGEFHSLPLLPTHNLGGAWALREQPLQIVGYSRLRTTSPPVDEIRAAVWTAGQVYDLNDLTVATELVFTEAGDINSFGTILVQASGKAVILEPLATNDADFDSDCRTNEADLMFLLSEWNSIDSRADLDYSGRVNVFDLFILLSQWTG